LHSTVVLHCKPLQDGRLSLHFPFMQVIFADPTNVKFVRHVISTSPPSFKVACVMIPFFIESTTGQEAIIMQWQEQICQHIC